VENEVPTKPESADPLLPVISRIEGKLDKLTSMVQEFFNELEVTKKRVSDLDERVSIASMGNGSA
jgi:hypothetical protein